MTPTQADREAAAEIWQSVKRAFLKDAGPEYDDIGNTLALPYATRHRLAAEAAAFEKAAGVPLQISGLIGATSGSSIDSALCQASEAIRKLAGEKHDAQS